MSSAAANGVHASQLVSPGEKAAAMSVTRDFSRATPTNDEVLQMLTLKQLVKGDSDAETIFNKATTEQTKYLTKATEILFGPAPATAWKKSSQVDLQQMYGRNFRGQLDLAEALKDMARVERKRRKLGPWIQEVLALEAKDPLVSERGGYSLTAFKDEEEAKRAPST